MWFKRNWGFAIFLLDLFASLVTLILRPLAGHYINYTEPARYLWRGEDPYDITFPGSPGAFFYSPGCALYFYGPFTLFPGKVGQFLYMGMSVVVFWFGLQALLKTLKAQKLFDIETSPYRHLVWLMAGSEMIGGIVAVKIDVLIVGIALYFINAVITKRHIVILSLLLGLVTSWKVHPLLIFGLVASSLVATNWRLALRASFGFGLGIAIGFASPYLVLPAEFATTVSQHWSKSLNHFVSIAWLDDIFQHLYGLVARTFKIKIELGLANAITATVGLATALFLYLSSRRAPNRTLNLLAAFGLGSGFVVMFSHLIQSNSYIVYFPLALAVAVWATAQAWSQRNTLIALSIAYFVISIVYSDLCPRPLYHILYDAGVKPLGVLLLYVMMVAGLTRRSLRGS